MEPDLVDLSKRLETLEKRVEELDFKDTLVALNNIPQGPSSKLDSDTVDGYQVSPSTSVSPNTLVPVGTDGKLPSGVIPTTTPSGAGVAKAWVKWTMSGSTVTVVSSFNVTSVTRNAQGDFTVTFTTAMADANYVAAGMSRGGGSTSGRMLQIHQTVDPTTTEFRFYSTQYTDGPQDSTMNMIVFFGN